jgi:hypothetical protein
MTFCMLPFSQSSAAIVGNRGLTNVFCAVYIVLGAFLSIFWLIWANFSVFLHHRRRGGKGDLNSYPLPTMPALHKAWTSDERTNHAAFFVGRCHGDIFIKNGSFSIQRGLKVRHSTKISTKFVKQVKSYSLPKYTTYM